MTTTPSRKLSSPSPRNSALPWKLGPCAYPRGGQSGREATPLSWFCCGAERRGRPPACPHACPRPRRLRCPGRPEGPSRQRREAPWTPEERLRRLAPQQNQVDHAPDIRITRGRPPHDHGPTDRSEEPETARTSRGRSTRRPARNASGANRKARGGFRTEHETGAWNTRREAVRTGSRDGARETQGSGETRGGARNTRREAARAQHQGQGHGWRRNAAGEVAPVARVTRHVIARTAGDRTSPST
jgi:hypothetical protein